MKILIFLKLIIFPIIFGVFLRIKLESYRIIERISFGRKIKSKNKAILALNIVISASCDTDLNSENNKGVKHNIISSVVFKIAEPV